MTIHPKAVVIGLTAPFGSGSTTSADILSTRLEFKSTLLSSYIRQAFEQQNPGGSPSRSDLQAMGDRLRQSGYPGVLAEVAVQALESEAAEYSRLVVDGIRNVAEIDYLQERFGNRFYLFGLECPLSHRWDRLKPGYEQNKRTMEDFLRDDHRDQNEEVEYGQQVQLCVDRADVLIDNSDEVSLASLRKKLVDYAELVLGKHYRFAKPIEIYMNLAYSASHGSKCIKRQVGAILVNALPNMMGAVVGQGFNENPNSTKPCIEEERYGADLSRNVPGMCYRDIVRQEAFVQLAGSGTLCPRCGKPLGSFSKQGPPWKCINCEGDLEDFFWPERAMTLCTAIHAEVAAILSAGGRSRNTTLYTTTFPCFQCAEKLAQAGITNVVFNELYPDIRAADRLQIANVQVLRFEGVRSRRFDEIFSKARKSVERNV